MGSNHQRQAVHGAAVVLRKCLGLRPGNRFLLIADETTYELSQVFFEACCECSMRLGTEFVSTLEQANTQEFNDFLRASIAEADGILLAHSADPSCDSFRISLVTKERGTVTVGTMPGATLDILANTIDVDYEEMRRRCIQLSPAFLLPGECLIRTRSLHGSGDEHQLTLQLGGIEQARLPIQSLGLVPRPAWGNIPGGEVFVAPLEATANGTFLVNGAVDAELVKGEEEVILGFKNGRLKEHAYAKSGDPVRYIIAIEERAKALKDENWNVLAEVGIGVNTSLSKLTGVAVVDEKTAQTVHIALGHNLGYGGTNTSSVHSDMTSWFPDIVVEEQEVMLRGHICSDLREFDRRLESVKRRIVPRCWASGRAVRSLNREMYSVLDDALLVKRMTESGRFTEYRLGSPKTANLALRVCGYLEQHQFPGYKKLANQLSADVESVTLVLELLAEHGVISRHES